VVVYKWEVPEVDLEGWDPVEDSWHPSSICSRIFEGNGECNGHICHIIHKGNWFEGCYFTLVMVGHNYFPLESFGWVGIGFPLLRVFVEGYSLFVLSS
jgi:hypothetical protein